MSIPPSVFCPICLKRTQSLPVEEIYFSLLENKPEPEILKGLSTTEKKKLFKFLSPPSFSKQPIWHVLPPDILFAALVILLLFSALYGYLDRNISLSGAITPLGLIFLVYALLRSRIMAAFMGKRLKRTQVGETLAERADQWSRAYYCFDDQIVYLPDQSSDKLPDFYRRMHAADSTVEEE